MADQSELIRAFPFVDLPDTNVDGYHDIVRQRTIDMCESYSAAHQVLEDMLSMDGAVLMFHAAAHGITNDYWGTLEEAGINHDSPLFARMLRHIQTWVGMVATESFLLGKGFTAHASLNELLKDIDLGGEGDGLE